MQFQKTGAITAVAILLIAASAAAQETVSLSDSANREAWRGEGTGAQTALSLDRGDVSAGDSRRDMIVGAPGWNANTGRVYVVFSGPLRNGQFSLSGASQILSGAAAGDRFGEATAAGYVTAKEATTTAPFPTRDLVVGAPGANGNSGRVYLFLRGLTGGTKTAADATLTITGAPAGARLGAALATGDLDGDGFRDIIIGAPGIGAVYVVLGGSSVSGTVDLSTPSAAFFKIQGSAADGVGTVLAAGDMLGHAVPNVSAGYDLAIGAPFEGGNTGAVYMVFGRPSNSFPATMNLTSDANARFGGIDAGDLAGKALQIAPIDKDKFADLIIGAPQADGPGNARLQAGEVYVIFGGPAGAGSRSLASADLTIYGAAADDREGSTIVYGDVNRDGFADFVSLAPGAGSAGELHLFNDRTRAAWGTGIDLLSTFPDRTILGDPARGVMQSAVVVDMTGEAFDDIAAGYPADTEGCLLMNHSLGNVILESPLFHAINPDVFTTFTAAATGSPLPTPQWQVSTDGVNWTNIPGATSTTFTFLAHASDNGKRFRAMFSSSVNSVPTSLALLTVRSSARPARRADFDGDGATDVVVWRPSSGTFFSLTSSSSFNAGVAKQWGSQAAGDKPFTADIDGDGMVDLIVWRPTDGTWYWLTSGTGYSYASQGSKQWGAQSLGDVPMVGDMDGDGKADLVIWRASTGTWYWLPSSANYAYASAVGIQFGDKPSGDVPMLGDFDGDGKTDIGVWRASTGVWFWLTSSTGYSYSTAHAIQWGASSQGDMPFTGDIDGDGKSELIVWRPGSGTWFWLTSSTGYTYQTQRQAQWGSQSLGDIPTIADFDGDGRSDLAVWRTSTGTWYWLTSSSGFNPAAANSRQWGVSTDIPVVK